ncbi:helix-turn-helix domain-containing protein [Pseudomonas syringae]|uniref:LysR family transcriptional regulator n=1 Tax=Pseudomonas pergaminensis TaxID=2853159 RepID=A0ABD8B434_9PSED|nr:MULTISPECIES: LysR family transcriptional regulator [Pseudomonas]
MAVVEALSFTEAAKVIGRDATIVSRRVGQLEDRLGIRLLSRTTHQVILSPALSLGRRRRRVMLSLAQD